jgi:hypothetical protein
MQADPSAPSRIARMEQALSIPQPLNVRDLWSVLLLAAVTIAVMSPVLRHRFIESWDDRGAILINPDYHPPRLKNLVHYWTSPATEEFYVPVAYTLWGLLAMIARGSPQAGWTLNPAFFYAANLLAHTLSAVLVYLILRRLISSSLAAWIGAAFFALHPIQVEAVANAWSVYTPLCACFGFLAIWQYLIFSDIRATGSSNPTRGWLHYAVATLAFALALLTKPTAVTVPVMAAVIDLGFRRRSLRQIAPPLGAWLLMAPAAILISQHSVPATTTFLPEPLLRPLVPLDAIAFYIGKILVPVHFVMDYGRSPRFIAGDSPVRWTSLITLALAWGVWLTRRRWPAVITVFAIFVAGLLPAIGIIPFSFQNYSTVADRYAYLAMLAPALAVGLLVSRLPRKPVLATAALVLAVLGALSVNQLRHWKEDWALVDYTLNANPRSLAAVSIFRILYDQADPRYGFNGPVPASSRCTLSPRQLIRDAEILHDRKFYQLSATCYRQAIIQGLRTPEIYARLAAERLLADERPLARQACLEALGLDPNNASARATLQRLDDEIPGP